MAPPFSLSLPPRAVCSYVYMSESVVCSYTALVDKKRLGVGSDLFRRDTANLDICRGSVLVLRVCSATDRFIVARCAVGGSDSNRLAEMRPYFLEQGNKLGGNENYV